MKGRIKNILTSDSWRSGLLTLVVVTIILLIRKTDSFSNPQFWAEDGPVFFLQQYENGASAIFQPYVGYLLLVPRLIALFADSFFPYSAIPAVYNFTSLVITLFVIASIFSPRFKISYKPLLALAIVLVPHYTNEVFLNVTNIQWILFISLIIVLMKEKPDYKYGNINVQFALDVMIIIICGLTGPFIIFLLPFFVYKWFKNKDWYNFSITSVTIVISFIQLSFILFTPEPLQDNNLVLSPNLYSAIVGYKVFGILFLGKMLVWKIAAHKINPYFLCIIYFCLIFMILRFSSLKNSFINICLSIQLIVLLAAFYKFRATPGVLVPEGCGLRYFYIPYITVAWSLIALLGKQEKWKNILITMALISILISSLTSGLHSREFIDYNWKLHSKSIGKEDVVIPINPEGWKMTVKAHPK